jgi:hypothetical protein
MNVHNFVMFHTHVWRVELKYFSTAGHSATLVLYERVKIHCFRSLSLFHVICIALSLPVPHTLEMYPYFAMMSQ